MTGSFLCSSLPWRSGYHHCTSLSLNSGSVQAEVLLATCRRFAMVRISGNGPGWKQNQTPFASQSYHKNNSSSSSKLKNSSKQYMEFARDKVVFQCEKKTVYEIKGKLRKIVQQAAGKNRTGVQNGWQFADNLLTIKNGWQFAKNALSRYFLLGVSESSIKADFKASYMYHTIPYLYIFMPCMCHVMLYMHRFIPYMDHFIPYMYHVIPSISQCCPRYPTWHLHKYDLILVVTQFPSFLQGLLLQGLFTPHAGWGVNPQVNFILTPLK